MRQVIRNELNADSNDHTLWMYRLARRAPGKSTVQVVVETAEGDLSELIEENGRPLTEQERQKDLNRIDQHVNSPAAIRKAQASARHDDQQAREFAVLLPDAFLWNVVTDRNGELLLSFRPNPRFRPPNMRTRAMEAVSGTMVVDKRQMRLKQITGRLDRTVTFGWGLLGRLDAGGTCDVSREEVIPGEWKATALHIHISGRTMFDTIGFQEDDVIDDFHLSLGSIDIKQAAEMLKNGSVARLLAVQPHP